MNEIPIVFNDSDPFLSFLRERIGQTCYLWPYLGNSGDELIYKGTEELLKFAGLVITANANLADLIVWPGGNPTMWHSNVLGWQEIWESFPKKKFVIAPATFQGSDFDWQRVLAEAKCVTGVFARDVASYENLNNAGLAPEVITGLSHDPALFLMSTGWLQEQRKGATEEHILVALRADKEALQSNLKGPLTALTGILPSFLIRRIRWEMSRRSLSSQIERIRGNHPEGSIIRIHDVSLANFQVFVEKIRRASEVHTDRLHVMLFAAMLGKRIVAYPTSYGKLEAVSRHSLKPWASVEFAEKSFLTQSDNNL